MTLPLLSEDTDATHRSDKLMEAVLLGHHDIIELLIKQGIDVDQDDENGETALMLAIRHGNDVGTKLLLDAGANVNHNHTRWGVTPLMYAVGAGHEYSAPTADIVKLLLERGARVNDYDQQGKTALIYAGHAGSEIRQLLLNAGAVDFEWVDQG